MWALSIRGSQERKSRHAPRLSVVIRGSVEIIKLLLYYSLKSEYSPRTWSTGRPAGDTLFTHSISQETALAWLDAVSQQRSSNLSDVILFSRVFLIFVGPKAPVPPRGESPRRGRPSSSNVDHCSSQTAGAPPVGRRARSARTTPLDYVQKTLLPGARSSPRLSGRTFPARGFTTGPSPTHQTCSLRARSACCTLPASSCAIACTSPRLASTSPKIARRNISFFLCFGGFGTYAHTKDRHTGINTFETPLAESYIGLRTPLLAEPDRAR